MTKVGVQGEVNVESGKYCHDFSERRVYHLYPTPKGVCNTDISVCVLAGVREQERKNQVERS